MLNRLPGCSIALLLVITGVARGDEQLSAHANAPAADRWMYHYNTTPGFRSNGSTFSALPADTTQGDDRLAQVVLKFDTVAAGIPAGLGVDNYHPDKVVLTALIGVPGVLYDPTEDPRNTYGTGSVADPDAGRPFELHGTGFRNSFTAATFLENSPFGASEAGGRNAYALGFSPDATARDVSNNVTQGFDAVPWAIGKVFTRATIDAPWLELQPGDVIPGYDVAADAYSQVRFVLDLSLPGVRNYVVESFHQGFLWLTLSSLHPSVQMASDGYPDYLMKEHPESLLGDVAATLDVDFRLPLRIKAFNRNGATGVSHLEWNASPGFQYVVETSSDLTSGSWQQLTGTPLTTATPATMTFNAAGNPARAFFRIARSPQP